MSESIARLIDHSLLHPTLTDEELEAGCQLARKYHAASVCIKPYAVKRAAELLAGSDVLVGTVIGFPHGSHTTEAKVFEAHQACRDGAVELDMVVNVGKVLSGDWDYVQRDIQAVVDAAHEHQAITKVIFENDYLPNDDLKIKLCEICERCGAEYVKTSSGFGFTKQPDGSYNYQGATDHDLALMREHTSAKVKVKAAGGVRTYEDAVRVRELGVTRIGATATAAIVEAEQKALA